MESTKKTRADYPNLRDDVVAGSEAARAFASMGGKASQAARRRRKNMRELAAMMLAQQIPEGEAKQRLKKMYDIPDDDITTQAAVVAGQIQSAMRGNTMAFATLVNLQQQEENIIDIDDGKPYHIDLDDVGDSFHAAIRDIRNCGHRIYAFKGGRGSLKSSTFGMIIPELMKNHEDVHALVVRKVGNTLKDSVFSQLQWAIDKQNVTTEFGEKMNPLEMTLLKTGQKIYFRGADKKEKIKSIKPPFGYIGILWLEELDQFAGEEEVRNIIQSAIRGGEYAWIFMSFNPPKSKDNWANKYTANPPADMLVHESNYLDVPRAWLGKPFYDEAENLRKANPEAYDNEYMGVANGAGGNVFSNIEIRTITDEEIAEFDNIYMGVDWGIAPDPYCFVRLHYDRERETVYFITEHVATGDEALNPITAQWIIDNGYDDDYITCDSAEKKSTIDYKDAGIRARNAKKGAGSVPYGIKWLMLRKLVIDPERTPFVKEEFPTYEFERDKEGNLISGYPDKNNHSIDATRYALERYCNQRYTA